MEEVFDSYKDIRGWFPKSQIELMDLFHYVNQKKEANWLWGKKTTDEDIEIWKEEFKKQQK